MLWFTLQVIFACTPIGWHCELVKSVSWVTWSVNQSLPEVNEVYVGMFHGAEPCTMDIDVFHILHNYSNIVSLRCNFQTNRGIYIWCKWMPNSYSWRAHTSSYSACAFMNINGYTNQWADTENKLYYMHFYLNVNDSHIHGMFIQTRFNKNKSYIYIMFQPYIYNYVHFRLRCLDSVFHSEQQRRRFFVFFSK